MNRLSTLLTPAERVSEILYGIIMTLSVTATLQVSSAQRFDTRALLAAALASNAAWGFVDAVMHLMNTLVDRVRKRRLIEQIIHAPTVDARRAVMREAVPGDLLDNISVESIERFRNVLGARPAPATRGLGWADYGAALIIWLLVFGSTLPLAAPFILFDSPASALRVSQATAVVILFWLGTRLGRWIDVPPINAGLRFAALGIAITVGCIALGG
jgi:hypothetical protein